MKLYTLLSIFVLALALTTAVAAVKDDTVKDEPFCANEGFNCECQNFYNSSNYEAVAKFSYQGGEYKEVEVNSLYDYYVFNVNGDLSSVDWTSSPAVTSVLAKWGTETVAFNGGFSGTVESTGKDISHITFCRMKTNGGCTGPGCGENGVPEFPAYSIGAAVLVVTLGLVFLRKD